VLDAELSLDTGAESIAIPSVGGGALTDFSVSSTLVSSSVEYAVVFRNQWSSARHPVDYPGDAHWSPPVVAAHNADYEMWSGGGMASPGVQEVAETGGTGTITAELDDAGDSVGAFVVGGGVIFNSVTQFIELPVLTVDEDKNILSGISMVAPSPDWIAGFNGFVPVVDGMWLESFTIESQPYDAGTDGGETFAAGNVPLDPATEMFELTPDTTPGGDIFVLDGEILPVASWEFKLI